MVSQSHAVLGTATQGAGGGRECKLAGAALAVPVEAVLLGGVGDGRIAHQLLEYVHVHARAIRPFRDGGRKQRLQPLDVLSDEVG